MSAVNRGTTVPAPKLHVEAFAQSILAKFGLRSGTYNGHEPSADLALDTFANRQQGDGIVQHAIEHWDFYGLLYTIWRQMINSQDGRGWRWMGDRGSDTDNHLDHVHDSFRGWGPAVPDANDTVPPGTRSCEEQIWMQGDEGDCVIGIQDHLNRYDAGLVVDGDYGPATRAAVTKFQNTHGLAADGVVGLKTWPILISGEITTTPVAPPRPVPPTPYVPPLPRLMWKGMSGSDVRQVQERLKAQGAKITVDGDFGPQTRAKVIIHQAAWRLDADGVVGPNTWATLWVDLP